MVHFFLFFFFQKEKNVAWIFGIMDYFSWFTELVI